MIQVNSFHFLITEPGEVETQDMQVRVTNEARTAPPRDAETDMVLFEVAHDGQVIASQHLGGRAGMEEWYRVTTGNAEITAEALPIVELVDRCATMMMFVYCPTPEF